MNVFLEKILISEVGVRSRQAEKDNLDRRYNDENMTFE